MDVITWGEDLVGPLIGAHRPADVLQAAALCMAEELRSDGFRWIKSRRCFERRGQGGRVERMTLEPSRHNRSGSFVRFAVAQLHVDEPDLGDWRTANHLLTVIRPDGALDVLCAASCYDLVRVGFRNMVGLTRPENRVARLRALCDQIRQIVLPWFASTRDPQQLAAIVPEALLGPFDFAPDLVEYLVLRGEREQARLLIERVLELDGKQREAFSEGRRLAGQGLAGRPRWHTPQALGWTSAVLGLS
ncbi:hypothetical protein [Actinomadura montaniterrae]|uniref:Uncharacterized protein n=1 Tax=Actinomadura montaniterrae TaxID=1803903 RepID=A0A6L3VHT4_9ACTN|nr:hypothetical protein [Actinomadura montaniterrae]KAB2369629.1 hypothetical protein F9B16_36645 [Actinomadura montaniterrae]